MALIAELKWRGLVQDIMPGTEEQLLKEITSGYIGFDPTADSLHIGSLVPILLLVHLQKAGHKPVALVGGATGMVGDPSGKSEERNLLDEKTLNDNLRGIRRQLGQFLDFDHSLPNAAQIVNNYDWFNTMNFLDFIRDVGKHITVNYMLSKDSVKKRLEAATGMSFTEFSYQLVQGYDFYWLYNNLNCKLQMGGSDQWGNITTGAELIRRKGGGEAFAFTCPLMTKTDGGKFGKTEKGNIWLDAKKTTPFEFFQFWINAADNDAVKWIKIFTFLSRDEIDSLLMEHEQNPSLRLLQKELAKLVTIFVHGNAEYELAVATTDKLFTQGQAPVESMSESDLKSLNGIIRSRYEKNTLQAGVDLVRFLAETGILPSKGEARKMVQNGGISINGIKIGDIHFRLDISSLIYEKYILIQKGKKSFYLVEANG